MKLEKLAMVVLRPNSVKLILVQMEQEKFFYVYDEYEEFVNIGKDLEVDGILKASKISETLKILKTFKKICETQSISKIISFCTHFISDAKNQRSFLEEIESACGLQFKIMTDLDEAQAIYTGIINTIDLPRGIIVSIEDTTTNIYKYNRRSIINRVTIPYGTATMTELFVSPDLSPEENCEQMRSFFAKQLEELDFLKNKDEDYSIIGIGKIFLSIGKISRKMCRYPLDLENNYVMSYEQYNQVYDLIKTLDIDKTKKLKGISSDRADVLSSGMCIIKAIYDRVDKSNIVISTSDLQDGILYNYVIPSTLDKPLSDLLLSSISSISSYLPTSKKNGAKVLDLAMLIFRQLRVLHKLTRTYVRAMKIAAYLYGSGEIINFYSMRKNCFEVILNLPIKGATQKEILLGAFIASSFDSGDFNLTDWVKYKDILNDYDLEAMRKLSAIVKIASGLDISQHGYITDIFCDVLGDSVIMKTASENNVDFEIKYGMLGAIDFKKAFGKHLEIL